MVDKAWMSAIAAFPRLGHLQRQICRLLLTHGPMTTRMLYRCQFLVGHRTLAVTNTLRELGG